MHSNHLRHWLLHLPRGAALLFLALIIGCAADTSSGDGAEDPAGSIEVNPQRAPEHWQRPADASDDPESVVLEDETTRTLQEGSATLGTARSALSTWALVPNRGVNLAGGEFGSALPGTYGRDYTFPTRAEVDYYVAKGMNTFRIGLRWERLQPHSWGNFDETYFGRLDTIVKYAVSKGARVILNPHNFARYYGNTVGSKEVPNSAFADFWARLASRYRWTRLVWFNLTNEPHDIGSEQWVGAANAAIAAIRRTGASNAILVPGNGWTGAHSWYSTYYGTPNARALLAIDDPADNVVFEAHQYLDANSSGGSSTCTSPTIGRERLAPFVRWLRDNHKKGFLGEFAGGNNTTCTEALRDMLRYIHESSDVLLGWLWWAGGPWWGDYPFSLEPKNGVARPQMNFLSNWMR